MGRHSCGQHNHPRDDEPQIRRVLQATLSGNGYDVILAKDGQEAIEMVIREHPDLILLDVDMPGMSGLEACSKIRWSFSGPIIMVTVRIYLPFRFHVIRAVA